VTKKTISIRASLQEINRKNELVYPSRTVKYILKINRLLVVLSQRILYILTLGHFPPPFISVSAVIVRGNEILLIKRKDGNGLCLPGGYLRLFEKAEDGAVREVFEETGLTVRTKGVAAILSGKRQNSLIACTDIVFSANIVGESRLKDSFEGHCTWRTISEIKPGDMAFDYYDVIISIAMP
jgi:ADP-ribose pyrophosphatase YjhB (NUDIX family)